MKDKKSQQQNTNTAGHFILFAGFDNYTLTSGLGTDSRAHLRTGPATRFLLKSHPPDAFFGISPQESPLRAQEADKLICTKKAFPKECFGLGEKI